MYDNNDERLVPFVGGLIIGGIGGAAFDGFNKNQYPMNYPNQGYVYPVYYYPTQYPYYTATTGNPQVNIYNPYITNTDEPIKIIDTETPLTFTRRNEITKDVPKYYKNYK